MAKNTYYFPHDYHARNDLKMSSLTMQQVGIYWCLVEMLYEEGGYISLSLCQGIANALRVQCEDVMGVIHTNGLFKTDDERFWSESVLRRLQVRDEKSVNARKLANKRWGGDAKALPTHSQGNAIKERKVKEIKVNINKGSFTPPTLEELKEYIKQNNYNIDSEHWLDHYQSNGWKVGKNNMKDWKATVRTWVKRSREFGQTKPKIEPGKYNSVKSIQV